MTEIKEVVRNALINDATYLSLMGDPSADAYETYYMRPPERPNFPETIIHFEDEENSPEYEAAILVSGIPLIINVWSRDDAYEQIAERVIQLLHHIPQLTQGFRAVMAEEPQELYDPDFNVYGKSLNFQVFYRRSTE